MAGSTGISSTAADRLNLPYGITLDSSNALYISDQYNNRVQKWPAGTLSGTTVAGQASGTWGSTANSFLYPAGLVVDSSHNLYVIDSNNHRVQFWANGAALGITIAGTGKKIDFICTDIFPSTQLTIVLCIRHATFLKIFSASKL